MLHGAYVQHVASAGIAIERLPRSEALRSLQSHFEHVAETPYTHSTHFPLWSLLLIEDGTESVGIGIPIGFTSMNMGKACVLLRRMYNLKCRTEASASISKCT